MTDTNLGDELQHFLRGFADSRQSGVGPQGLEPRQTYNMPTTFCKTYDTTTERSYFCL